MAGLKAACLVGWMVELTAALLAVTSVGLLAVKKAASWAALRVGSSAGCSGLQLVDPMVAHLAAPMVAMMAVSSVAGWVAYWAEHWAGCLAGPKAENWAGYLAKK